MNNDERINLVAPCGIDCGICELHTCTEGSELYNSMIARGIPKEKIPCSGCRAVEGNCPVLPAVCTTYTCVDGKKKEFCFACDEFPCAMLQPSSDRANILPHNLMVFNLCSIKRMGVENFIQASLMIKQKYYKGKMTVGKGPQLSEG